MISICIPIYNFDVRPLVNDLTKQIQFIFEHEIEIILIDDASNPKFRTINSSLDYLHQYIQLDKNIGRAKIRNLFLNYASQPYLLFLDCDSSVAENPNFIKNYIHHIQTQKPLITYGGRIYPENSPTKTQTLSWKYGKLIESKPAHIRALNPNKSFQTNNFIIHRSLFKTIRFDESIKNYGHEDTLFGIEINQKNIEIKHLENPVLNHHIEDFNPYISKTNLAVENLAQLILANKIKPEDYQHINLLKFYNIINRLKLDGLIYLILHKNETKLLQQLSSDNPNLKLFNLYKLLQFLKQKRA